VIESSAVPHFGGQAASLLSAVPGPVGQAASSLSAVPGPVGQAATPTQEMFGSKHFFNEKNFDSSKLNSEKSLKQNSNSRTMSAAEHFSPRFSIEVPRHQASSAGHQASPPLSPQKSGSRLTAKLLVFFQLLLQLYQDVVNSSKVLPAPSFGVLQYLKTTGPPIASPF